MVAGEPGRLGDAPAEQPGQGGGHSHAGEPMLELSVVQNLVLERCSPLGVIEVSLAQSVGHVLGQDLLVREDIPAFANTAMDGYAVRAADTANAPVDLHVIGVLAAGSPPPSTAVGPSEALQIMTGAPMPPGADGVAIVERTEKLPGGLVRVLDTVAPGANVRPAGSDFRGGSVALQEGTLLGPVHTAILSSIGIESVPVWRRPRVGVMSTGDELVVGGGPLLPGQIRDSNRPLLLAMVRRDGFEPVDLGVVRDTEKDVEEAFARALDSCDAVLSSGGVSKGDFDYVKVVLDRLATERGGESFELSVAIRPAKPLALAWLARSPTDDARVAFFGLPGNPISSMVSYQVIALPGLRRMSGASRPLPAPVPAIAGDDFRPSRDGRLNLLRVKVTFDDRGRLVARSAGGQQSHQLSGAAAANALALVPSGDGIAQGHEVEVLFIGSLA